jgi:hypothetical protein
MIQVLSNKLNIAELIASKHNNDGLLGIDLNLIWSKKVSNSHSCPRGGVTNWGYQNRKLPTDYPGWTGRVWLLYRDENSERISPFGCRHSPSGLHTHTGGGGLYSATNWTNDFGYPCSYNCSVFDDDHPEFAEAFGDLVELAREKEIYDRLRNQQRPPIIYSNISLWKHPDLILYQQKQKQKQKHIKC